MTTVNGEAFFNASRNSSDRNDPEPIPLIGHTPNAAFPTDALPVPIGAMVEAVAEATQTDPSMAGTVALSVMSATAAGRCDIDVRRGWNEILALQTATIARPGERKSAVHAAMSAPLLDVEEALVEEGKGSRMEIETQQEIANRASERARQKAGNAEGTERHKLTAEAVAAEQMAQTFKVPPVPRIVADDVTPEAAASLLAEQGGRLAILSAEGGVFEIIAGRYSGNIPNLDVFLKGHAGDPLRIDRRGRDPEYVRRPALAVGVMIQPTVLATIGRNQAFRGRGLLARFLYCRPTSYVGRRRSGAPPVPEDISAQYAETIKTLVNGLDGWGDDPVTLSLDPEAQQAVISIEEEIEPQLAADGLLGSPDSLAEWGSKFIGAIMRITALLHLAEHGPEYGVRRPVSAATLQQGMRLGAFYKDQAIAAFAEMQIDQATTDAIYLLQRIGRHDGETITVRDMQRLAQKFKGRAALAEPVQRLVDRGYLITIEQEHTGPGRPPSPLYKVHPSAQDHLTQMTQMTQPVVIPGSVSSVSSVSHPQEG